MSAVPYSGRRIMCLIEPTKDFSSVSNSHQSQVYVWPKTLFRHIYNLFSIYISSSFTYLLRQKPDNKDLPICGVLLEFPFSVSNFSPIILRIIIMRCKGGSGPTVFMQMSAAYLMHELFHLDPTYMDNRCFWSFVN